VIVVGGGAVGAASAYELARRGARVTVLERSATPSGCSYGNAGLICPSHAVSLASLGAIRDGLRWMRRADSPFSVSARPSLLPWLVRFAAAASPARSARATASLLALAKTSLESHERLASSGLPTGFLRCGILSVFETERMLERARRQNGDDSVQFLEPAAARAFEPTLAAGLAGAAFYPRDAHCDPGLLVDALLDGARAHGAEIRRGIEVTALRRANGSIAALDTRDGAVRGGTIVLAAGTWTGRLAATAGMRLPLVPAKGYHVEVDVEPLRNSIPIYMEEARVIATPLAGRLRFAGTLELGGLDLTIDPVRLEALPRAAARTLDLPAGARRTHVWCGLRPCTPDGLPLIGPVDGIDNLVLAAGHAMLGITLAPATGEMVAALVSGEHANAVTRDFRPSRFRLAARAH
jgi:D-amino-acid dehydrogenase